MIRTSALLCVLALSSFSGCKKQPNPAQLAAATFVEHSIKDYHSSGDGTLDGKEPIIKMGPGEPVEGTCNTCGEAQGRVEWVRTRPGEQSKLPSGDVMTETAVDICMTQDQGGACNRPNSYSFKAIMRNEGGAWKVAGSTCVATNIVR